jgi:hypothetical protein
LTEWVYIVPVEFAGDSLRLSSCRFDNLAAHRLLLCPTSLTAQPETPSVGENPPVHLPQSQRNSSQEYKTFNVCRAVWLAGVVDWVAIEELTKSLKAAHFNIFVLL